MPLTRREIVDLIPHGESMCMLDEVVSWDSEHIHCRSTDFARASNPLFEKDQLHSVMLIEYAAQAAAVHAAGEWTPDQLIGSVTDGLRDGDRFTMPPSELCEAMVWRIAALTDVPHESVNRAAKTWLDVDAARIVVVGDAASVRPMLEQVFGAVEVVGFLDDPAVAGEKG